MPRGERKRTLPIWNYFEKSSDGIKTAMCNFCHRELSYKTTITNLKAHLKQKHITEYLQFLEIKGDESPLPHQSVEYDTGSETSEYLEISGIDNKPTSVPVIKLTKTESLAESISKHPAEQNIVASIAAAKKHINQALISMKSLAVKREPEEYDEYDHFAHMIAAKIRKIQDVDERETIMNSIQNVVYKALMKNI